VDSDSDEVNINVKLSENYARLYFIASYNTVDTN
jgi:hypothetical protein